MATNITISTGGTTTVVTVPSVSNNVSVLRPLGGSTTFTGLTDTPPSFTASKFLKVNSAGNAVEFVDAPGGASNILALSDTPSSFTANKFAKVNLDGDAIEFVDDSNLNALVTMLKGGSSTTLTSVGDGTSTDKGVLNLGASSSSLKFNTTGITIDESSPGDIEFVVATDSSGSTAFTALHLDGTTTANEADFIVKQGASLAIEGVSSAKAKFRNTNSGNTLISVPASSGTLALTSQITSDTNTQNSYAISCVDGDNSDEEKIRLTQSGADGAATDDIVLEAGTGLSIARAGDKITFTNTVSDTNTMGGGFTVSATTDTTATTITEGDDLFFAAGTGITCETTSDGTVTISSTITNTNTQNAYAISCVDGDNSDEEKIRLTQSGAAGSATDDIVLEAGTGLSIARAGDKITFTNTVTDTNTTDLVTDTSPQLGGNLDVNGQDIVTTSNGDIDLDPNGTGKVVFKGNSDKGAGQFVLNCEQNSHGIVIKGPPHSAGASYTLTLPNTDGSSNQVLKTDGSGNLDWVAQTSDTNTQNTTTLSFVDSSDDIILRNTTGGAGSGTQDITINAGSNITLTHTDANNITIAATTGTGSSTFVGLSDTPGSFTASKFLKVNSAGNAIEFVDNPSGGLSNVVEDTTPQLGGNLDVNGNKIVSTSNGDIDIEPNGTGDVLLGNFKFDVDQTVGSGQDNYVLTYDNSTGKISLEGSSGGGLGGADQTLSADRTIDTNGYNLDIELDSSGTADTFTIHDGTHDLFQVDTTTSGTIFSVNDVSGLPKVTVNTTTGVDIPDLNFYKGCISGKGAQTSQSTYGTQWRSSMSGQSLGRYQTSANNTILTYSSGTPSVGATLSANNYSIATAYLLPGINFSKINLRGNIRAYDSNAEGETQHMEVWTFDQTNISGYGTTTCTFRGKVSYTFDSSSATIKPILINSDISYSGDKDTGILIVSHAPTNPGATYNTVFMIEVTAT